jgi:hypothetical protein
MGTQNSELSTLIVYELVPERVQLYLVNKDNPIVKIVEKINNLMQNGDDLTDKQESAFEKWNAWTDTKESKAAQVTTPLKAKIVQVLSLGFFL